MELKQIFSYAIEQEVKARKFYELSAEQTDNAEAKSLFANLARMEIGHEQALQNQLDILTATGNIKLEKVDIPPAEKQLLSSLRQVTKVLKDANIELQQAQDRREFELDMAARIQGNLLPRSVPQLPDLAISVSCFMAGQVGGDYYDYLPNPLGRLHITIGDVSGKGMPAALLMVAARTLWRSKVREGHQPHRVLELLNQDLASEFSENEQFITILSAAYEQQRRIFTFSNAGHWPPLYFSAQERDFVSVEPGYLPIGIELRAAYRRQQLILRPGDLLVLFSDGITDARNQESREFFGEGRLKKLVAENHKLSAEELRALIISHIQTFSQGQRGDDQTLIILKSR